MRLLKAWLSEAPRMSWPSLAHLFRALLMSAALDIVERDLDEGLDEGLGIKAGWSFRAK